MTPKGNSHTRPGEEKRRRARLSGTTPGWIVPEGPAIPAPWEIRVQDVSRHGVGFESSEQLQDGETVKIRIGRGPIELARRMRIVRCDRGNGGIYRIGGEFV